MTTPEDAVIAEDQRTQLREAVARFAAQLKRINRRILTERMMSAAPLSLDQLASEAGISRQAVHLREKRLRVRLREHLVATLGEDWIREGLS